MSEPILVNKDAEWLDELGQTFITDGDFETGMRLRSIALRYQQLDTRLLTLSSDGAFVAGRQSVYQELMAKSNLPPEYHAHKQRPAIDESKVRRMPAGKTSEQLQAAELAKKLNERKREERASKFAGLSGLKLNLEVLKK